MSALDLNQLKEEQQRIKDQDGRGNFLANFVRMPEGKGSVVVRLLPPAPGGMFENDKNPFYQWTRIHRVNNKSLHDPRTRVNGRWVGNNPIGDYLKWLWKESEKATPEECDRMRALYREIKPIERYYYNCIVRREEGDDGVVNENVGPKILSVGVTLHQLILRGICGDEQMGEPALGDVTDPKVGRDFKIFKNIVKSGQDSFPKYDSSRFLDKTPLGTPEEVETWMNNLHDLSSLRVVKSVEEIDHELKIHLGVKTDAEADFDPSEYQKSNEVVVTNEPQVSKTEEIQSSEDETAKDETAKDETAEQATDSPSDSSDGEEVLADDEFLSELKSMGV